MTTVKYVGAATLVTSLLWTWGARVNSNLIEGIARNNDSYNKGTRDLITQVISILHLCTFKTPILYIANQQSWFAEYNKGGLLVAK